VRLTIVGGQGEMVEHIPGYIKTYGVENRVNWVGLVSFDQMKQYYIDSDVLFFTSLRDSCPHQLVEAMSYCMPILTLDLHGQGELVDGSNGIKVPVTTETEVVDALARGVEWMAAHPDQRRQMGLAGYEIAKGLIWDQKIRRFVDELYPALIKSPTSRTSAEVSTP
uniref:glycosyltransferase family 4 protein n=1 Tax=Siphonobacter sp. TaxID=1869184 RepID=UPI003B3AF2FA